MILQDNEKEPTLLGIMQSEDEYTEIDRMVHKMNTDLVDSGFEQYQYQTVRRGNKLYVELKGA